MCVSGLPMAITFKGSQVSRTTNLMGLWTPRSIFNWVSTLSLYFLMFVTVIFPVLFIVFTFGFYKRCLRQVKCMHTHTVLFTDEMV